MNPKRLYRRFQDVAISWYDPNFGFVPVSDKINISVVDQFLSNFNRPTRRRMMHCNPEMELGEALTLRDDATGNIFIVGEPRTDQERSSAYVSSYLLHLVTPVPGGSAGMANVVRKVAKGPKENPGWLEPELFARTYMDVEVAAVVHETGVEEVY